MRTIRVGLALAVLITTSGCTWLFQDSLRGGYESYERRSEPNCSTTFGWTLLDTGFGLLGVGQLGAGLSGESVAGLSPAELSLSGLVDIVIHGASAITGLVWRSECEHAYRDWEGTAVDPTAVDPTVERLKREADAEERAARAEQALIAKQRRESTRNPTPQPRGFYCSSSPSNPTAGMCTRDKSDCESAHGVAVAAGAALDPCVLVEVAYCFRSDDVDRCAPSIDACDAQHATTGPDAPGCVEAK